MKVLRASIIVIVISISIFCVSCGEKDYEDVTNNVELTDTESKDNTEEELGTTGGNTTEEEEHPSKENGAPDSNTTEEEELPTKEN